MGLNQEGELVALKISSVAKRRLAERGVASSIGQAADASNVLTFSISDPARKRLADRGSVDFNSNDGSRESILPESSTYGIFYTDRLTGLFDPDSLHGRVNGWDHGVKIERDGSTVHEWTSRTGGVKWDVRSPMGRVFQVERSEIIGEKREVKAVKVADGLLMFSKKDFFKDRHGVNRVEESLPQINSHMAEIAVDEMLKDMPGLKVERF